MIRISSGVLVVRLPAFVISVLRRLPRWQHTPMRATARVQVHSHDYPAMYFTKNVKQLRLADRIITLPPCSLAIFLPGTKHGWEATRLSDRPGLVGHFHRNHGPHTVIG